MKKAIFYTLISILTLVTLKEVSAAILFVPSTDYSNYKNTEPTIPSTQDITYEARKKELETYKDFFQKVNGINLTKYTTEAEYKKWLTELRNAKTSQENAILAEKQRVQKIKDEEARKEHEAQEKIKDLETRIKALESQNKILLTQPVPVETPPQKKEDSEEKVNTLEIVTKKETVITKPATTPLTAIQTKDAQRTKTPSQEQEGSITIIEKEEDTILTTEPETIREKQAQPKQAFFKKIIKWLFKR